MSELQKSMIQFKAKIANSTAPSHKRVVSLAASAAIRATTTANTTTTANIATAASAAIKATTTATSTTTATTKTSKPFSKGQKISPLREYQRSLKRCYEEDCDDFNQKSTSYVSGSHAGTQLHIVMDFIKSQEKPISLSSLENRFSKEVMTSLMPLLGKIDRLKYHSDTRLFVYGSFTSASDLNNYLHSQPTFKGTPIGYLKDGWTNHLDVINELEMADKILVKRSKKDNSPVAVWPNMGGPVNNSNDDSVSIWGSIKLPKGDDLAFKLAEAGLKATSVDVSRLPQPTNSKLPEPKMPTAVQMSEALMPTHLYPSALQQPTSTTESGRKKPKRGRMSNYHSDANLKSVALV